jgi:hypothetical protein
MRPHFDVDVAKNIVAAFSNSAKIPVSRIEAVAELAAKEVVDLLQKQQHADLRQLVDACASQHQSVYGLPATVDLAAPVTQGKDERARQLEAEKAAREAAEKWAREAEARARQAQAEAREAEERARRQAEAKANTQSSPPATAHAPSAAVDKVANCSAARSERISGCKSTRVLS